MSLAYILRLGGGGGGLDLIEHVFLWGIINHDLCKPYSRCGQILQKVVYFNESVFSIMKEYPSYL